MKYSVIIPCFNSEKTIDSALGSIYLSPYYDHYKELIEVIVVNDGSTDGSDRIIEKYKTDNPSLVVLKQENLGVGEARKRGVLAARGEYLVFLDSDDLLHSRAFESFEELTRKYAETDIIRFSSTNFIDINSTTDDPGVLIDSMLDRKQFVDRVICGEIVDGTVSVTVWGKLYKRELFLLAVKEYGDGILSDYYINMQYYEEAMSCVEVDNSLYWYRVNTTGISHSYQNGTARMLRRVNEHKRQMMERLELTSESYIKKANAWLIRFVKMVLFPLQGEPKATRKKEYYKYDKILKDSQAYTILNDIKNDKEVKLLRTRIFTIIDFYFGLRWKKSKKC